jgi:biotin transporter BioY
MAYILKALKIIVWYAGFVVLMVIGFQWVESIKAAESLKASLWLVLAYIIFELLKKYYDYS